MRCESRNSEKSLDPCCPLQHQSSIQLFNMATAPRNSYNAHIHATARHNLADGLLGRLHSAKVSLDGVAGLLPLFASSGPFLRPLYHYILNNAKLKNTNKSQRAQATVGQLQIRHDVNSGQQSKNN